MGSVGVYCALQTSTGSGGLWKGLLRSAEVYRGLLRFDEVC